MLRHLSLCLCLCLCLSRSLSPFLCQQAQAPDDRHKAHATVTRRGTRASQPGDANPHHPVGAARVAQLAALDLLGGQAVVRLRVVLAKGEAVVELCPRWGAPTQAPA